MSLPDWLQSHVDEISARRASGEITRYQAAVELHAAIEQRPEYARAVVSEHAGKLLAAWDRARCADPDPLQGELFPGLSPRLHVSVGKTRNWLDFTRHDWETARNMLLARTANQARGAAESARREREDFMRAYDRVVPLLTGPALTTADVAGKLRGM